MMKKRGFTLIEVLIALAILAIALLALIKVSAQSVAESAHLKEKLAAHELALNISALAELHLLNDNNGQTSMLGLNYQWQLTQDDQQITVIVWKVGSSVILSRLKSVLRDEK